MNESNITVGEYWDANLMVDYAEQEHETFFDAQSLDNWVREKIREYRDEKELIASVFVVYHEHPMSDDECQCIQYMTDHRPYWTNRQ